MGGAFDRERDFFLVEQSDMLLRLPPLIFPDIVPLVVPCPAALPSAWLDPNVPAECYLPHCVISPRHPDPDADPFAPAVGADVWWGGPDCPLQPGIRLMHRNVLYKVDEKPMFPPGNPPEWLSLICQSRRDSHKVKVRSDSIVPSMHLGKSYRAFLPSAPLRSPRQWSELPEGPLGLLLVTEAGQLRVRRPSALEIWMWMHLPD